MCGVPVYGFRVDRKCVPSPDDGINDGDVVHIHVRRRTVICGVSWKAFRIRRPRGVREFYMQAQLIRDRQEIGGIR